MFSNTVYADELGVNTHISHVAQGGYGAVATVKASKEAKFGWIRDSIHWGPGGGHGKNAVEAVKGKREVPELMIKTVDDANKKGISVLLVLGYGNALYGGKSATSMPTKDDDEYFNAFIEYVKCVAEAFDGKDVAYEIWNEPNLKGFNAEEASMTEYAQLYIEAREAIKGIDEDAVVLCGAVAGPDTSKIDEILTGVEKYGGIDKIDAFSIHRYSSDMSNPSDVYLYELNNAEKVFDNHGYTGDVWMTETGWYSGSSSNALSDEELAASLIIWSASYDYWLNSNNRGGKYFIYDLKNDGQDESEGEHNFGLLEWDYTPKTGFCAMQSYNRVMHDKKYVSRTFNAKKYFYTYQNEKTGERAYMAHSLRTGYEAYYNNSVTIPTNCDEVHIYNHKGELIETKIKPTGNMSVALSKYPKIIECVNYGSSIEKLDYDDEKNVVNILGIYEHGDNVTITLTSDNNSQSVTARVNESDEFDTFFSVDADGDYTLTVGKEEITALGETEGWASEKITVKRKTTDAFKQSSITDGVVVVNNNGNVTVTANLSDYKIGDEATVLVVPSSVDIKKLKPDEILYVDQIKQSNSSVNFSFEIENDTEGMYSVYIGNTRIDNPQSGDLDAGEVISYLKAADMNLTKTNASRVKASVKLRNFTDKEKPFVIMISQYDDNGSLLCVNSKTYTVPKNTVTNVEYGINAGLHKDVRTISAMVLEDTKSIRPLVPKVELK